MNTNVSRFCYTLLTAALLCTSAHAATSADSFFPNTTKGFVAIKNLKDFGEQWKQTQFGKLLDDSVMGDFKEEVQTQVTEVMKKTFGFTLDTISSLPSGELAFGMVAVPTQTPGFVLIIDTAEKKAETDKYLAELTQKFVDTGIKKETETYKGQQITILTFPPSESPPAVRGARVEITFEPVERKAYYMFFQNWLIGSDQLHLLKLLADRITEPSADSLATVEAYQVTMKRCLDDVPADTAPIIRWYIEPLGYGESVRVLSRSSIAQNRREKSSIFSILKQQGFDAIQGIGGIVSIKTEDQEVVHRTFIHTKKPYRLAMRMLEFPDNTNFAPPTWMPGDLARCTMFYVDPVAIFENIGVLVDAFLGEEGVWDDILKGLETDVNGPMINIRTELIDNLGNRVLGMSRYEKPITANSENIVVAVELKEGCEPAMLAGMEKLFGTDPEMGFIEHNSHKIWHRKPAEDVIMPEERDPIFRPLGTTGGPPPLIQVQPIEIPAQAEDAPPVFPDGGGVVAKGAVFVATNIEYLKVILDRLDTPEESAKSTIVDDADYKAADRIFAGMGITEKPHFFQFFAKTHETLRPTYEMIRQDQMAQSQAVVGKVLNAILSLENESGVRRQVFDGSTMPEFDKIEHYFGKVGVYGVTEDDGYFIKGFTAER